MSALQRLDRFALAPGQRGRSALTVQLWWLVQGTLFRWSPQVAYGFRRWLLRCFGARIGRKVLIRPTATVTYPWKVEIGDYAWIGDDAVIYSLGPIHIGAHAVISQRSYLCAADHDPARPDFPLRERMVRIEDGAWVAKGSELHRIAPVKVERVVDTTGAGDAWAGGFLYGHLRGLSLAGAGALGSALGAECVQHLGPAIPEVHWTRLRQLAQTLK